jgi:hypothetical protein
LAISVASGVIKEWLGYNVLRHGTVLYILNDGSHRSLKNRIRHISEFLGIPKPKDLYILYNQGVFESWQEDAERFIRIKKPILVVIDSLAMSSDKGDENSASDQKKYSNLLKGWCLEYNLNVSIVHHTTKASAERPMHQNNFRGSNHWIGVLSSMLEFRKKYPDKPDTPNIYRLVKSRDGDKSVIDVRESSYVEIAPEHPVNGMYDLTQRATRSGYRYMGKSAEIKAQDKEKKQTPFHRDIFQPGVTKSYRQALDDIMERYHRGRTSAKEVLNEWVKEDWVIRSRNPNGGVSYTSTEKPNEKIKQ